MHNAKITQYHKHTISQSQYRTMHNAHERHSALHGAAETEQAVETTDNRKSCNCSGDSGDFLCIHIIINSIKNQDHLSDGCCLKVQMACGQIILEPDQIGGGLIQATIRKVKK